MWHFNDFDVGPILGRSPFTKIFQYLVNKKLTEPLDRSRVSNVLSHSVILDMPSKRVHCNSHSLSKVILGWHLWPNTSVVMNEHYLAIHEGPLYATQISILVQFRLCIKTERIINLVGTSMRS